MHTRFKKIIFLWKISFLRPFYPFLKVIYGKIDCKNSRMYFSQAMQNYQRKRFAAALLNLNMVLYLNPKHFEALVLRGRILIEERKYELAANDFVQAYDLSPFRFHLESLHTEALDKFPGLSEVAIDANCIAQSLRCLYKKNVPSDKLLNPNEQSRLLDWDINPEIEINLSEEEKKKFDAMGPIKQEELEAIDWNRVFK